MTKEEKLRKIAHKKEALVSEIRQVLDHMRLYGSGVEDFSNLVLSFDEKSQDDRDAIKKVALLVGRYEKLLLQEKALKKS